MISTSAFATCLLVIQVSHAIINQHFESEVINMSTRGNILCGDLMLGLGPNETMLTMMLNFLSTPL